MKSHYPGCELGDRCNCDASDEAFDAAEVASASAPVCSRFRAGDTVRHRSSEEEWILACDEEQGRISPCGWPETLAEAKYCELIAAATEPERIAMLKTWHQQSESDHRTRAARRQLPSENTEGLASPAGSEPPKL
jgi:hypothetical protein